MRVLFKIGLMPIVLLLDLLLMIFKGFLYITGGIINVLAVLCLIAGIVGVTNDLYSYMVAPAFISAFILSPFGIQLVAVFVTVKVENLRDWLNAVQ